MPFTTADIGNQLLMHATAALLEIEARGTAQFSAAFHNPERGPAVQEARAELLAVMMPAARMA